VSKQTSRASNPVSDRPKAETRKGKIVAIAIEIIAVEGYPGFSMRNIARRLDVRLAAIQHYFPTKRDLLRAAMETVVDNYTQEMEELRLRDDLTPDSRLARMAEIMISASLNPTYSGFFVAFWALAAHDDDAADLLNALHERGVRRLVAMITLIMPDLSEEDCVHRAITILSMLRGATIFVGPGRKYAPQGDAVARHMLEDVTKIVRKRQE
jgi:AcrR family transcriptional regulator